MIPDKTARILTIERIYGQHIENLLWSGDVTALARKWGVSREAIYTWRVKYPRTEVIHKQVMCVCGSQDFDYDEHEVVQCWGCGKVTTWMLAHRQYRRAL